MDLSAPWAKDRPLFQGQRWQEGEGFYRWTDGPRVLIDVDGQGRGWASRPVRWLTEAGATSGQEVNFAGHCVALALEEAPITVWAGNGFDLVGKTESGCSVAGPGWILAATSAAVDGDILRPWIPGQPPIPVVHQVTGDGLLFLPSGLQSVPLDRFTFTKAELKARGGAVTNLCEPAVFDAAAPSAASLLNRAEWPLELPAGTVALALGKSYDRFHGRQRCRVLVNGEAVAWWHLPREDREARPGNAWTSIPLKGATGSIRLALDPPAGVPLWSIGQLEIRALVR